MSSGKSRENGAERKLMTLDQLSQTIEVMTGVVNRLKRHLNMQLTLNASEIEQTVDLSRELLHNERELQELQQLANQQRNSVPSVDTFDNETTDDVASNEQGSQDSSTVAESRGKFIIEISRPDDADRPIPDNERVLH